MKIPMLPYFHMKNNYNGGTERIYAKRFSTQERQAKIRLWSVVVDTVFERTIHAGDTIIDIGAGSGEFLLACTAKTRIALDPISPASLRKYGITVFRNSFSSCPKKLYGTADIVMLSNVLEHLHSSEEMIQLLTLARRLLKLHGKVIIIQPVIDLVGLAYWDFLDHTLPITRKRLLEAMNVVHLKIVTYIPRFLPYTTKSSIPKTPWLVSLYLYVPWFLRPFAGQVLVIAEK